MRGWRFVPILFVALALAVAGCGRAREAQAPRSASRGVAAEDTLANGVPRALVPRLADWFACWERARTDVRPDLLRRGRSASYAFRLAPVVHAGSWRENARTRAGIEVLAPDSLHAVDFDMELEVSRDADGVLRPGRDVDSGPLLADFAHDSLWIVDFCGTPCGFDGAAWLDANRFVVVGSTQTGLGMDGPRAAFVDLYDLERRTVTRWLSSPVADAAFGSYATAAESALTARVIAADDGVPAGRTILSRALQDEPVAARGTRVR